MASHPEFERLKNELLQAEMALKNRGPRLVEREELQAQEEHLKIQVDALMLHSSPLLKEAMQQLEQIKVKKRALDHLLDAMEEATLEKVEALRAQLTAEFLTLYPEKKPAYEEMRQALSDVQQLQAEIALMVDLARKIVQLLGSLLQTRQHIRRKGLLSYIFGDNPTSAITQYLQATELLARTGEPKVQEAEQNTTAGATLQKSYGAFRFFLQELQKDCRKRWGFGRLDRIFTKAFEEARQFETFFAAKQEELDQEQRLLKARLDAWLQED